MNELIQTIGAVGSGGALSLVTSGFKIFKARSEAKAAQAAKDKDHEHEMQIRKFEAELARAGYAARVDETSMQIAGDVEKASIEQAAAAEAAHADRYREAQTTERTIIERASRWVVNIKGLVRPVLALEAATGLVIVIVMSMVMFPDNAEMHEQNVTHLYILVGMIFGYYFVDRTTHKGARS